MLSGTLLYHIEQGNTVSNVFGVSRNGTVSVQKPLTDHPEGSVLNFKIYAVDTGGQQDYTNVVIIIPDTSVPTVVIDNTIQYQTFFTHAPNMVWFVPLLFTLFGSTCIVTYAIWATKCDYHPPER